MLPTRRPRRGQSGRRPVVEYQEQLSEANQPQDFQRSHDEEGMEASQPQFLQRSHNEPMRPSDVRGTSEEHARVDVTKTRRKESERKVNPEELGLQIKRKLAISSDFPVRPGEGTLGKKIKLISNCFPLKIPSGNVYHYDVNIIDKKNSPQSEDIKATFGASRDDKKYRCLSTHKNREILELAMSTNPLFNETYAAFDGRSNLYSRDKLRAHFPVKFEVILTDGNEENPQQTAYEVQIKPANKAETNSCAISLDLLHALYENRTSSVPQEAVMALETILRHGPCLRFTPIGRSFFSPPSLQNLHPLGGGLEIWFGYHQSLRLGQWSPMVNLDLSATTFFQKGPVLKFMADGLNVNVGDLRRRHLSNIDIKKISNKLKNLRMEVTHLRYRRKYRILKLVTESANRLEFEMEEDGTTVKKTVAAYFRDRYQINLDFPHLPCLQVHPENKKRYFPVEVCEILEGQHCKQNLDSRQKADMVKSTALLPKERFRKIKAIAGRENDTVVQGFGIEVSKDPMGLEGRVLDSPSLVYKDGETVKPKDGSWNLRATKFLQAAVIDSWVLLSFANISRHDLQRFCKLLVEVGKGMGISFNEPQLVDIIDPDNCNLIRGLSNMKTKYKATLAVIVIPVSEKTLYGRIKQAAETSVGLVTQCIKESNVVNPKKCSPQLVSNLCLKINAKMNGVNHSLWQPEILPIMRKPVIIIGADVNHPGSSRGFKPSLAACVATLDNKLSRYAATIRVQHNIDKNKKSVEIIVDLESMVKELLKAFYGHTKGKKPLKIIFFRDGVSEGQFEQVRNHEVVAVRRACKSLEVDYEPGITFIVVQKRHHVRFMPANPRDGVGTMQNVPPGTTVDTVVTHPVNFDYYLCSHFGLKGTSRPCHYTILEDDNAFSANDIQTLSYQLCHTYARCTKSISIPTPVKYADLVAYRARLHFECAMEDSTSSSDSSLDSGTQPLPQSVIDAIQVKLKNVLYFV